MTMSISNEIKYTVLHLYHILLCWLYQLYIHFAHGYLFQYNFFSPDTKAFLDHEYQIVTRDKKTLLTRLWGFFSLLIGLPPLDHSYHDSLITFSRLHAERIDTPAAAFLRIIQYVCSLPTASDRLNSEIKKFWSRGLIGASKPDHFLLGDGWHIKDIPDPRVKLGNDPILCAVAASTAEQMVEVFNWRIGQGVRRDLRMLKGKKPYWDKDIAPCQMETAPDWCKEVGPALEEIVIDVNREGSIDLSPSFKKRNLLAGSLFMYSA